MTRIISGYPGKAFEDFIKGERIIHRLGRTVTFQDNLFFANLLLNTAALHFDKELMQTTEFKQPLLVATMTLGITYGITSEDLKNVAWEKEIRNLQFKAPVFEGDSLHVETEVLDVREHEERKDVGIVLLKHRVYKSNFTVLVCEFEREILVYKRDYLPRLKLQKFGDISERTK
jgi:acyl dehydratase